MSSILTDVKEFIGITEEDTSFDRQIITCINSVFSSLTQVLANKEGHFFISDKSTEWSEFVDDYKLEWVRMNVCMNVKKMFDPPTNGTVMQAMNEIAAETQWRAYIDADNGV